MATRLGIIGVSLPSVVSPKVTLTSEAFVHLKFFGIFGRLADL
jgi:hypothetical protein